MGNELFEQTLPAYAQDRAGRIDPHARSVKPRAGSVAIIPTGRRHASRCLIEPVPYRAIIQPTRLHGAARTKVIPSTAPAQPARLHYARRVREIPRTVIVHPPGAHAAGLGIEAIPRTRYCAPARCHRAIWVKVIPGRAVPIPACLHCVIGIKKVIRIAYARPSHLQRAIGIRVKHPTVDREKSRESLLPRIAAYGALRPALHHGRTRSIFTRNENHGTVRFEQRQALAIRRSSRHLNCTIAQGVIVVAIRLEFPGRHRAGFEVEPVPR